MATENLIQLKRTGTLDDAAVAADVFAGELAANIDSDTVIGNLWIGLRADGDPDLVADSVALIPTSKLNDVSGMAWFIDEDSMATDSAVRVPSQQSVKAYVDSKASGLDPKAACRCATTANITLSGEQSIDGVTTTTDRVLVKDQTAGEENGIYVSAAGAWSRAADSDSDADVTSGMYTLITEGTISARVGFVLTTDDPITLDTTSLTFETFLVIGAGNATVALDNLSGVAINESLVSDTDITDDLGTGDIRWDAGFFQTLDSGFTATDTFKLRACDTDGGPSWVDILSIVSSTDPTAIANMATLKYTKIDGGTY